MKSRPAVFVFYLAVFSLFSFFAAAQVDTDALLEQIKTKEAEIGRLEEEAKQYRGTLAQTKGQVSTLQSQVRAIEKRIAQLTNDLKITRAKITKTDLNIKSLGGQITQKQKEIESRKIGIGRTLRAMAYLDSQHLILALLKSERFSNFFGQAQYLNNLQSGLYYDFRLLAEAKKNLEGFKSDEQSKKSELTELKGYLTAQNQLIAGQKIEKDNLLRQTKNQEKEYQKLLLEIQRKQAEVQQEIFELEDQLRGKVADIPGVREGLLAWPLAGIVTQFYGATNDTGFVNHIYKFHNGIDVTAHFGAPIRAALDGEVAASGDNGQYAYGQWIAIRHNNGLVTLYAHLSRKAVNAGDIVRQGQIIGYEGATGFVTGSHLHFTVYSTNTFRVERRWYGLLPLGGTVDPLDYL